MHEVASVMLVARSAEKFKVPCARLAVDQGLAYSVAEAAEAAASARPAGEIKLAIGQSTGGACALVVFVAGYCFLPLGKWVSQVRPDSGSTCVKPVPAGGLGIRMRC